ncbi:Hypothetical predicted protein, partial [Mytilus galloprovincialis]
MKITIAILLAIVAVALGKHCSSNHDCTHLCHGGYHGHCTMTDGVGKCNCPEHKCQQKSDCPTGHGVGCPDGHADC